MSPDGALVATPGAAGTAILWNLTLPVEVSDDLAWVEANRLVGEPSLPVLRVFPL